MEREAKVSKLYAVAQTLLFIIFAVTFFFDPTPRLFESFAAKLAGNVIALSGLVLMAAAFVVIRRSIQIEPMPRADGQLVTSGPYSMLRHPIYTGIVLVLVGLLMGKPTVLLAAPTVIIVVFVFVKSRFEERLLLKRYPAYAEYMKRSWGVFPGVGRR